MSLPSRPLRVLLDTDPGIDDALAILLALASPEIDLAALAVVHGNCALSEAVRNGLDVLALGGAAHIPVAAGCDRPLLRPRFHAPEVHGVSGLGYAALPPSPAAAVAEHAVDLLIREVMAAPGEVTLVAVGPLTNVALAMRKEPRLAGSLRELIYMGGAFRIEGNASPLAEFNVYADPHAAQIVFTSGAPITIMPWDITRGVRITDVHIGRLLERGGPIAHFVAESTRYYMEMHRVRLGFAGCSLNDPAALALAYVPELAVTRPVNVEVELSGELSVGKTVADFLGKTDRAPNVRLVEQFDGEGFVEHFLTRIEALIDRA
ncbi:nucleoside hydrolase [Oscillochloris sp. ZM17-4]|uniref:nucleoside hydrolase n=1 Tax=Oscillochloris sp. ZM17-4 TaxID=2866714 RepID=UPI001C732007|nr:nucleoside hydrolase [Oscillochloris sp. ZM17-4]MBX0326335.1 nucleoside hydrolase [Oscillochloris sp. ZM17-4]